MHREGTCPSCVDSLVGYHPREPRALGNDLEAGGDEWTDRRLRLQRGRGGRNLSWDAGVQMRTEYLKTFYFETRKVTTTLRLNLRFENTELYFNMYRFFRHNDLTQLVRDLGSSREREDLGRPGHRLEENSTF